jgi:hypothetical protein
LHRKHIELTVFCEVCGADKESIRHILTKCTTTKMFCREVKSIAGVKLPNLHHVSWVSDLMRDDMCTERERAIFITGMQGNKRQHGEAHKLVSIAV